MQIAVWVSAILFTQRLYRTTTRWVRQGDCCVCVTSAKCTSQKMWSASTFHIDATKIKLHGVNDRDNSFRPDSLTAMARSSFAVQTENSKNGSTHGLVRSRLPVPVLNRQAQPPGNFKHSGRLDTTKKTPGLHPRGGIRRYPRYPRRCSYFCSYLRRYFRFVNADLPMKQ